MYSSSTPASSHRTSTTYSTHPSTPIRPTSTPTYHPIVVDTYPSSYPPHTFIPASHPAVVDSYPSTHRRHTLAPTSRPAAVSMSAPTSSSFHNRDANTLSTSRTTTTSRVGYKSVIERARATQKEDAQSLYESAKARHAHKLRRAKQGRERADEAAIRIASSSNLNIDDHYQQLLVGIKENVKATFEAQWISEVREDVYHRYPQIASEYESEIRDETYTFLVDSLEPVVKADLRQQFEPQIREELREELRAEVRAELRAQHQAEKTVCHQVHAASEHVHSKAVQTREVPVEGVLDTSSSILRTRIDTIDVNVGANDVIDDLDGALGEEVSSSAREVRTEVHGQDFHDVPFQGQESPIMESVEIKDEHIAAIPRNDQYETQPASQSGSVGSKRSWSSEDDYEENQSPSKRRKNSPEDSNEVIPWPFHDDDPTNEFEQEGSPSPPNSDDSFDSEEENQDAMTPGPFIQLAPQLSRPPPLIAQTNTAENAWLIDDSDEDEEGAKGEMEGRGNLVGTGFISVNKAGVHVTASELFLNEEDDV